MCLSKVDRIYKGTSKKVDSGYKVFRVNSNGELRPLFMDSEKNLPEGEWLDEKLYRETITPHELMTKQKEPYPLGWHVFVDRADAERCERYERYASTASTWASWGWYSVRKVSCKGLLAKGTQNNKKTEVYKYIKIEKDERERTRR